MADNNAGQQGGSQNNKPKTSGLSWSQPSSMAKPSQTGSASAPKITPALKAPAMAGQNSGRKTILLFLGGVVVGGLLAWSWFSMMSELSPVSENTSGSIMEGGEEENTGTSGTSSSAGSNTGSSAGAGPSVGASSVVVPSPQAAGLSVMVSSASVSSPTWVVVYESQNGVRGNALGAALFFPNGSANTVKLLRATQSDHTYFVGRHIDNGDKQFSLTNDQPVVNAAGNPVYVEFRTN